MNKTSKTRLASCDPRLIAVVEAVSGDRDIQVIEGHRSEARQAQLYAAGRSKVRTGGKHNRKPSQAVDIAPLPINWGDTAGFEDLARLVLEQADKSGVKIRWGGDWESKWDRVGPRPRQRFDDLVHFELVD